ncbi:MAG: alpha-amylase family glycosyl hydrolase, partial [Nitrospiraceae bacterium]
MMPSALPRIPSSTYRLQFNRSFTFQDARTLVPYLRELGISDCYSSSYLKAAPGSQHGYDIADPTSLNPELGDETEYLAFIKTLQANDMGHILDIVPNHMGIARSCNPWWLDVLQNGPSSVYAAFFDIDWHPLKVELDNKILLPMLGDLYGVVLENQEIALRYDDGAFFVQYYDHTLPVAPKSMSRILSHRLDDLIHEQGAEDPHVQELQSILTAIGHLPPRSERDPAKLQERYREKEIIKRRLAVLVKDSPVIGAFLDRNVMLFNGTRDDPA